MLVGLFKKKRVTVSLLGDLKVHIFLSVEVCNNGYKKQYLRL